VIRDPQLTRDRPPPPSPTRRPPRWQWAVSAVSAAGAVAVDVLANEVANVRWVAWPSLALIGVWLVVLVVWQVRSRRQPYRSAGPDPAVPPAPAGRSATLPYTSGFVGRDADLAALTEALDTEHAVAVVGRRGVGTSSCAVHAANLVRDRFPSRQIYLDLRAAGRPLSTRAVLAALAAAVGTEEPLSARPAALTAAAQRLRERLDDRRILLVLDNVDDPAQVGPLLPPSGRCRLLLAGAPALARVPGVAVHWLAEPEPAEAVELFAAAAQSAATGAARPVDPRTDPVVPGLVELCGRQPGPIQALGYLSARHGWRPEELLATLRHAVAAPAHQRVPVVDAVALLADRDVAYAALRPPAQRLLRLLSLAPGPLSRDAIAALHGRAGIVGATGAGGSGRVVRLLAELADAAFVRAAPGDRYEVRPPLAGYARLHLLRDEPPRHRVAAQARLLRHLARRAERQAPGPGSTEAGGWFERHQDLLYALIEAVPGVAPEAPPLPRPLRRWWFRAAVALCVW
jgi:hypothetical protein